MVDMNMSDTLVSFDTAKLAKEKGFKELCFAAFHKNNRNDGYFESGIISQSEYFKFPTMSNGDKIAVLQKDYIHTILRPTQSLLQKFIRETRGVHIEIHRNASGYYWSMCMSGGGTDLGWSESSGPNDSGVWDSFEDALENALKIQLSYDLPNDTTVIKHWGNYVEFALKTK